MKFYDAITKNNLRDEINRICGTTDAVYSLLDKLARIDQALDNYWFLASQSAPKGVFDDTSNTAVPIETQNLVSGTNAYKISDFTNEVLQILKVSVLDEDGIEHDLKREDFDDVQDFEEQYDTSLTGVPEYYTILGDYIYIRSCPDYNETNGLRLFANRELSKYTPVTFTTTNASNQIDATAHGLVNGDTVILSTAGVIPTGYTADTQIYFVVNKTTDSFQVATSNGGTAVTISDDGTGTHQFVKISKTPGIPVIHHKYLARKASLDFLIEKKLPQMDTIAQLVMKDEAEIQDYWANREPELKTKLRIKKRVFK